MVISSCVTFKQFDNRARDAKEPSYPVSLIKKDGTVYSGQELKHKNFDS